MGVIYSSKGNTSILKERKLAFFCSQKCPGNIIIKSYDLATTLRDKGVCIISGFHTPIEQDVLHYLLKGRQPIIICPAKSIDKMRIPKTHRSAYENNRILYLSPLAETQRQITAKSSIKRNQFIVDLADEIIIAYAHPGSKTESVAQYVINKGKKVYTFSEPETINLIRLGAHNIADLLK